jgi:hypothetical protein
MRFSAILCCFVFTSACSVPTGGGVSGPCTEDSLRCADSVTFERCIDGTWQSTACPEEEVCGAGHCFPGICSPNTTRCGFSGREICSADGSEWLAEPCSDGLGCTGEGVCAEDVCEAGSKRCFESEPGVRPVRQVCNDEGLAWEDQPCSRRQACVGAGECETLLCIPGGRGCVDDSTIGICSADGRAWEPEEDCPVGSWCRSGRCVSACESARARSSYDGCDFFAVDLPQIGEAQRRQDQHPFAVVLANPQDYPVTVSVTAAGEQTVEAVASAQPTGSTTVYSEVQTAQGAATHIDGPIDEVSIPAGGLGTFILPSNSVATGNTGNDFHSELADRSYRVQTSGPVTAYQFQPLCCNTSYTNDASILMPVGSQGRSFFAVSHPYNNRPSYVSVVASEFPAEVTLDIGNRSIQAIPGHPAENGLINAHLEPYQVLTVLSASGSPIATDLTGVAIQATTEVSVFGGHICTNIPHGANACDHLETAVLPVETWRNQYVGAHTHHRSQQPTEVNYYRVIAARSGTTFTTEPALGGLATHGAIASGLPNCRALANNGNVTLGAGDWCEFGTRADFVLNANQPVQLTQFISGQSTTESGGIFGQGPDHAGDPAMTAVPPTEQFRDNYTFLTPATYALQYVNIIHPVGAIIELDGEMVGSVSMGNANRLPYVQRGFEDIPIGSGAWRLTIVKLAAGAHDIKSLSGDRFGIMVYAYDDYVSYAYPGGMDLTKQ